MRKYTCHIRYKCKEELKIFELMLMAIKVLGFEPRYMRIFFDEFSKPLDNISFDEEYLLSLIKKNPSTVSIKNELYDENDPQNFYGFSLGIETDENFSLQYCSLTWSNRTLDFLVNSDYFNKFLRIGDLIYCYCYDQYDCHEQSNINRINPDFDQPWKSNETAREFILHDIDISEHWGRSVSARGMLFMAAPLMWFGEEFYKIIPKEELIKFKYSSLITEESFDMIYIKLFDLYDIPSKEENRNKQKEFWKFFDLQTKIDNYKKDNSVDFIKWLKKRAELKKAKKKNK